MGGTLFDLVKAKGQLEEEHTQFYAACITEPGFQIDTDQRALTRVSTNQSAGYYLKPIWGIIVYSW